MKKTILSLICLVVAGFANAQSPKYEWALNFGGLSTDFGKSIAVDKAGNVYTTGSFRGRMDFDPGPGVFDLIDVRAFDVFISKLDAKGNFVWAKMIGGFGDDAGESITLDDEGNVYITGGFGCSDSIDFDPGEETYYLPCLDNSGTDIFILKLDVNGNFVWVKTFSETSNGSCSGYSIKVDSSGNIYTMGTFSGTVDFNPGQEIFTNSSKGKGMFLLKLDNKGNFVWAKQLAGRLSWVNTISLAINALGNIYVSGTFQDTFDFDNGTGVFNLIARGFDDIFISKFDSSGNFVWAKSFPGDYEALIESIVVDELGNSYTTGSFRGILDFDPGIGVFNLTSSGQEDIFILKLDPKGNFVWVKRIGDYERDMGTSIGLDLFNNIYITGIFYDYVDFNPGTGTKYLDSDLGGIFLLKLNPVGDFIWAKNYGSPQGDPGDQNTGISLLVDNRSNIYSVGCFRWSGYFDPITGNAKLTSAGDWDIFIHKMSQCSSGIVSNFSVVQDTLQKFKLILINKSTKTSNITYYWDFGDGRTSTSRNPTHKYNSFGKFQVCLTLTNAALQCSYSFCDSLGLDSTGKLLKAGGFEIEVKELGSIGLGDQVIQNIWLYPNPTNGFFNLDISNPTSNTRIEIYNSLGILVYGQTTQNEANIIDLSNQPNGLYFAKVISADGSFASQKIVKQ